MAALTIFVAFIAGIISFVSPCILPILPGFVAYLSGTSSSRTNTFVNSLFFVLGFALVFAILGLLLSTALAHSSYQLRLWLGRIAGLVIIVFALHLMGLIKIDYLQHDHKLGVKRSGGSFITSFMFGASFAVGWSPCVGAILGSVFALAVSQPGNAFILLIAYAIGLGVPFLLLGIFTESIMLMIEKSATIMKHFNMVVGILLLILGILVFTSNLNLISSFLIPKWLIQ